eukprot:scaffold3740_cov51-Cyclotella_meneghiniana.AAC.16
MDSSSVYPAFVVFTTANAALVAIMMSPGSSPGQQQSTKISSANNSPKLKSIRAVKQRSPMNWLWGSPSTKSNISSKHTDTSLVNSSLHSTTQQKSFRSSTPPKPPPAQKASTLLHSAISPRRITLDPRISNPNHKTEHAHTSECSFTEEPKSILHHSGYKHLAAGGSASSNQSSSCTMTPTVMFSDEVDNQQIEISSKRQDQQFHHSPHWTGKVRINPFSPVPSKYLEPLEHPSSRKSLPHLSTYVGFPILSGSALSPIPHSGVRRSRRLKPKNDKFPPSILDDKTSPTDVMDDALSFSIQSPSKRKSGEMPVLPQSTNDDVQPPSKKSRLNRGRYLEDFEEVRHIGSGSFGSVNACLSRLDGCMYAIKSISPHGIQRSNLRGYDIAEGRQKSLYGERKNSSFHLPPVPPTPRRDVIRSPVKRRQKFDSRTTKEGENNDIGTVCGTNQWTDSALRRMLREVHALAALCNQPDVRTFHIVRYHQAWFEKDGTLYIQTELCSNTLRDETLTTNNNILIKESPNLQTNSNITNASQRFKCLREMLLALQLVHEKGMVHLDLKPDNIFVHNGLYKLGDFGLAGVATSTDVEEGDSRYMPREMLEGGQRDLTKCDIFSLGATMYELCLGHTLPSCGEEWHNLRNGKLTAFWPPSLYQITREMMHPDPAKRPSASDLLSRNELSCRSGDRLMKSDLNDYNICLKESGPLLRRSSSWTL